MHGKVKIAAVGLGNRTCKYLRYVEEHGESAELVAVVDPDPSKADWARDAFSLPSEHCFRSFDELAASGLQLDACIIGTPDLYHHEEYRMVVLRFFNFFEKFIFYQIN